MKESSDNLSQSILKLLKLWEWTQLIKKIDPFQEIPVQSNKAVLARGDPPLGSKTRLSVIGPIQTPHGYLLQSPTSDWNLALSLLQASWSQNTDSAPACSAAGMLSLGSYFSPLWWFSPCWDAQHPQSMEPGLLKPMQSISLLHAMQIVGEWGYFITIFWHHIDFAL